MPPLCRDPHAGMALMLIHDTLIRHADYAASIFDYAATR